MNKKLCRFFLKSRFFLFVINEKEWKEDYCILRYNLYNYSRFMGELFWPLKPFLWILTKRKKSYLTVWYVILPFFHVGSIAKKFRFRFIFMWDVIYNSKDAINEANKNLKRILIDMGIKSYSCILNVIATFI